LNRSDWRGKMRNGRSVLDLADLTRRAGEAMRFTEMAAADAREQIDRVDKPLDQLQAIGMAKTSQPGHLG
jgi:hypothetical protein